MPTRPARLLSRFAPPIALMALIFFFSAQPHLATDLGTLDVVLRKLAHMAEYGLLWFLWWRALGHERLGASIAITLLYAVSDEVHQTFVDGRHGSPWDVAIDAAGVGLAGALVVWWSRRRSGPAGRAVRPRRDGEALTQRRSSQARTQSRR